MKKINIYLCDLTYDTIILVSDTIPINIGFIGSYLKKNLREKINIELFKYPNELLEAITKNPPEIIGFSNYSWNSNLSEFFAGVAKKHNPNSIVLQGGTNFPHKVLQQKEFLLNRPNTDVYALYEGEKSALNVVKRFLETNGQKNLFFQKPIDGCVFLNNDKSKIIVGNYLERIKDLDEIPSPYLNGMLDKFFDGRLTPFIETNRGCPFTCSFCHTGSDYYHKLNKFSEERVKKEIEFIGERAGKLGITNLHLADVNFGMYPQDKKVCEYLLKSKEKNNWPLHVMSTTGKNNKKRVMEITSILGNMFSVNMSLQSMDNTVLNNIKRSNIRQEDMIAVNNHLRASGRATKAELILPLPGESKKTFIDGLNKVLESNASSITIYTLMMLYGTEFKDPEFRNKFNYQGKYRIVPLNFGEYNGQKIFDFEEVGVSTKDLSFDDYLQLRAIALMIESIHNGKPFDEFFTYAKQYRIKAADLIYYLIHNINSSPTSIKSTYDDFIKETKSELWDNEKDLVNFYKNEENYKLLKDGKVGGNLIYKYKSISITKRKNDWIVFLKESVNKMIIQKNPQISDNQIIEELNSISIFVKNKLLGILEDNGNIDCKEICIDHDVLGWIDSAGQKKLGDFKKTTKYFFSFSKEQIRVKEDYFKRYGVDINAISKIVTRISNLESQFRLISKSNVKEFRPIYQKSEELFVKYALSN